MTPPVFIIGFAVVYSPVKQSEPAEADKMTALTQYELMLEELTTVLEVAGGEEGGAVLQKKYM